MSKPQSYDFYESTLDHSPDFDEPDFDYDEPEEEEFDCGFVCGEGCLMAGTEDCDFECPYRDRLIASPYYPNCDLFGHQSNDPDEES